ncbi:PEP-CTERM system TPR-repeat protein PrsT [Massilia sp. MB5]|uniref:XrtA/PEP-CTERM system TPR-repeat protein PrsT n=1 Tax=Massilia sp. MB5 TaxID=2919578 RepID=UPI001F0E3FE4|nr:XrtA/PEP-CTERM system TPR-repeat protein PrsT [Massilia sp. MB5]UMR29334.1 PEP-CTERM system TPR-repeat protein PrsT [Massilia sp. MB5]
MSRLAIHFPPRLRPLLLATLLSTLTLSACERQPDSAQLLAAAHLARQQGDHRTAMIELKNLLQQNPRQADARLLLGEVYLDTGEAASAEKELRRAQQLGLAAAAVQPALGRALLMQGRYDQLLAEIALDPARPLSAVLRGHALLAQRHTEQAAALYAQALQRQPDLPEALLGQARLALLRQDAAAALRLVEQALRRHPAHLDSLRLQGDLLRDAGRLEAARRSHERILALRPRDAQARIDIAHLQLQAGQLAAARASIAAAREVAPNSLLVLYAQALLDYRNGQHKAALERLQQILRAAPDHPPSLLLCGAVQAALGAPVQAEQHLRKFLDAAPGQPYASKLLASVLLMQDKPTAVVALLQPLQASAAPDAELLALLGEARMRLRQFSQAAEDFRQASALAPATPALHMALGISRLGSGDNARAIGELERAAAARLPRAGVLLVMTHLRTRDFGAALAAVQALERQGANPLVHNLRGGVQVASQDLAGARRSFEQALALDALYQPALDNLAQLDLMEGKPQQARQRYLAALARQRGSLALQLALAQLAIRREQRAEALDWLEQACRDHPEAAAPALLLARLRLAGGDVEKALSLAQKLQAAQGGNADALALLAEAQNAAKQPAAALESLSQLAQLQPASASVQLQLARQHLLLRQLDAALLAARKALGLQAQQPEALALAVALLLDKQAYAEALKLARQAQQAEPDRPMGYKLEGDILLSQQQAGAALPLYGKAYTLAPSGPLAIALHRARLAAGRRAEAAQQMQAWLRQHEGDAPTRLYYASSLMQQQDYRAAAAQLERLVAADGRNVIALNDLAWAYQQLGDARALDLAERAYRLAPNNPAVADTLGWILQHQGQTARAVALLKRAVEQAPTSTDIRYHLVQSLAQAGDRAALRRHAEQLLASRDFPQREQVRALLAQP